MSIDGLAPRIADAIADREHEGRTRAARALLMQPVLRPPDGEDYRLARRHAEALRDWFARQVGWRLLVDSETVRLEKQNVPGWSTAQHLAGSHAARVRRADPPFTRRRYVLLCLILAVLERSDHQVALGALADAVVLLARQPGLEDVEFTLKGRDERSDLVAAIRLLLRYGALSRVAGDEDAYVSAAGDALYDVDRRVLSRMLAAGASPAVLARELGADPSIDRIEEGLHRQAPAFTKDEANRRLRHRLARRLLEDPVLYYADLTADERNYLVSQRVSITTALSEMTGLVPELRAEGLALVDPDDQLTDLRMPDKGTEGHATLLLAEHLASKGGSGDVTVASLRRRVKALAKEHDAYWSRVSREPGAEVRLVDEALSRLTGLGLVRVVPSDDGDPATAVVRPLPALARFAVTAPTIRERKPPR